jgi:GntR family transcriptional regulator
VRSVRYQEIAEELRSRVAAGEFASSRLLPSEADLGAAYAASRITVRRALELLREDGLVESRQGLGWLVAADPLRQSLGRLGTIEAQLADAGMGSQRQVLDFGFVRASPAVQDVLAAPRVLEVRRVNLADGEPFARVTVWCPEPLAKGLSLRDVERTSFYELLGIDLGGAMQTIAAAEASTSDAELLHIAPGSAVLVCHRTTRSAEGVPVLYSEHVFPAHRTEFVVELTHADRSIAPSGLRLVEG